MPRRRAPRAASAYQRALERLARRDHTEREMERLLAAEGYPAEEVAGALETLRQRRYLDDPGLARRYARSRLESHGLGRHRIRQDLRRKGVADGLAERAIAAALREVPEAEALDGVARRYWRQHARVASSRRLRGLYALLLRRGFPALLVAERLRALFPRLRDLVEGLEPPDPGEEAPRPAVD